MRVLVIGAGAAGRRHVRNLSAMEAVDQIDVFSRRAPSDDPWLSHDKCRRVKRLQRKSYDFAMVCNETHRHIRAAALVAGWGVPLFIEKPLAHRRSEVANLQRLIRRKPVPVYVAYNLRFLGALKILKSWIQRRRIGRLCFARIEAGQYLPDWRPRRAWKETYSAQRARGGGVALDLSHEIDYMRWLFGDPKGHATAAACAGEWGSRVDTVFEGIYRYPRGFLCSVHLDYLQRERQRSIRVTGTRGTLECDLIHRRLVLRVGDRRWSRSDPSLFDIEATYVEELRYFMRCLKRRRRPVPGLRDGARALELIDAD